MPIVAPDGVSVRKRKRRRRSFTESQTSPSASQQDAPRHSTGTGTDAGAAGHTGTSTGAGAGAGAGAGTAGAGRNQLEVVLSPGESSRIRLVFRPTSGAGRIRKARVRVVHAFGTTVVTAAGTGVAAQLYVANAVAPEVAPVVAPPSAAALLAAVTAGSGDGGGVARLGGASAPIPVKLVDLGKVPTNASARRELVIRNAGLLGTVRLREPLRFVFHWDVGGVNRGGGGASWGEGGGLRAVRVLFVFFVLLVAPQHMRLQNMGGVGTPSALFHFCADGEEGDDSASDSDDFTPPEASGSQRRRNVLLATDLVKDVGPQAELRLPMLVSMPLNAGGPRTGAFLLLRAAVRAQKT